MFVTKSEKSGRSRQWSQKRRQALHMPGTATRKQAQGQRPHFLPQAPATVGKMSHQWLLTENVRMWTGFQNKLPYLTSSCLFCAICFPFNIWRRSLSWGATCRLREYLLIRKCKLIRNTSREREKNNVSFLRWRAI